MGTKEMSILDKLSLLKYYMIGSTVFGEEDKKFMAVSYYESAMESDEHYILPKGEEMVEVIYASNIEEIIEKAYEAEQKLL